MVTVEDETAVAQLLALVLCGPKCKVIGAGDGVEALEKIAASAQPFDIIITDHKMPRMTLKISRARSSYSRPFWTRKIPGPTQAVGVDLLLAEPFDMDELRNAVEILADEAPDYAQRAAG